MAPAALRVHRGQSWRACVATRWGRTGPTGPADSIWVLRLRPDVGTIKTGRARTVPLHADLVRQGFREFAQRALAALGPGWAAGLQAAPKAEPQPELPRAASVKARERLAGWVRLRRGSSVFGWRIPLLNGVYATRGRTQLDGMGCGGAAAGILLDQVSNLSAHLGWVEAR
jgi:hypothetical protein